MGGGKQTILVVDDDPAIRIAVSLKMKTSGFLVEQRTDGVEAFEYLESEHADLMVVDVGMPRMNGYELCMKLYATERSRELPVVILTAQDTEVPEEVAANIGRHHFLMKPFSPKELLKVVQGLLAQEGV